MLPNIRHFVQAVHLCPDRWGSCDQIRSQFEHKGHCSSFLTTIVAFVLSLHDILHLWCLQVVDGRIGCLHVKPVDQLYPLLPHQEAMFNDVVDSLAQTPEVPGLVCSERLFLQRQLVQVLSALGKTWDWEVADINPGHPLRHQPGVQSTSVTACLSVSLFHRLIHRILSSET